MGPVGGALSVMGSKLEAGSRRCNDGFASPFPRMTYMTAQ